MIKVKKFISVLIAVSLCMAYLPANSFAIVLNNTVIETDLPLNNFAKITSASFYDSDTTIINIQDLHNNKEVQDNILKLLEALNEQYENLDVYIEGASSPIDYNKLSSSMNTKDLSVLMNSLYDNDRISGAEYFGYKQNKILKPTELKNIYDKNIQNYSLLIKNKQEITDLLLNKYEKIRTLDIYLTKEQRKFLKYYNSYLNKKISPEKFYEKVLSELTNRKISVLKYVNVKLYIDVMKAGATINRKAAELQLKNAVSNLKSTMIYQDYVDLLKKSNNLTDINVIFAYLSSNINSKDKVLKYPDLFKMISLKELSSLIDPLDLVEEERQMMEDILLSYSKYQTNKEIVFLNLFFQVYKKLLSASISSNEYIYYKQNYDNFYKVYTKYLSDDLFDLYFYMSVAEQFNELNLKRNLSFVKNISSNISVNKNYKGAFRGKFYNINKILSSLNKKAVKVIISGGFHTDGINSLLDKNKISYITLTPNIKNVDSIYEQKYLDSIIEQADVENNAISKKPFFEQSAEVKANDIVLSLDEIFEKLKAGKSIQEVNDSIKNIIKANEVDDIIKFDMDKDGVATIKVNDKVYVLNYENGKVEIESSFVTTLAKNIKLLIREALKVGDIRANLGLKTAYDETEGFGFNQQAEYFLMKHNILFPKFADICLSIIVGDSDKSIRDRKSDKVYQALLQTKNGFRGDLFNCDITVGSSKTLIGITPDGYGNTEEYGSLFYVVWENVNGAYVAKEILVSEMFIDSLKNFQEQDLKRIFRNLFMHERLEMLALSGQSEQFNQYVLENKVSRTSEVFHEYIHSDEFSYFLEEQKMSLDNLNEQRELLDEMDRIISDVNKANSQYSNIISVSSIEKNRKSYKKEVVDSFLSVRAGEEDLIKDYNSKLLTKVAEQIEREYVAQQKISNPKFDIEKDFDAQSFVTFINKFVIVYRNSSKYIHCDKFASSLKKVFKDKFKISDSKVQDINIKSYELKEDNGTISLENPKEVKGKKVLFVEDIISKQSETFNNVYNTLMDYKVKKVQGVVLFDLSKEPEGSNLISDSVYNEILKNPKQLLDVINKVDGKVNKYLSYWLVRLSKEPKGEEVLKQILSSLDEKTTENLMASLIGMLDDNNLVKGVKSYEIFNLALFIGFGEKKDIDSIKKSDMDKLLEKYDFRITDKTGKFLLEVSYDDWKESIASLILYAYMLGYEYIDALKISNILQSYGEHKLTNKRLIDNFCREFNISFMDKKTKLKHSYFDFDISQDFSQQITHQKRKLDIARRAFKQRARRLTKEGLSEEDYLQEMEKANEQYRTAVKNVMIDAKDIVIKILAERNMKIDDDLFAIIIGGSLVKGNMMAESDIYYDIIVPDGTISKSIDNHFAPLYSSVLQEIGLTNYYVSKYSSTNMTRNNINTFVDEKEITPFLNYEPLSMKDDKKQLYFNYRTKLIDEIKTKEDRTKVKQSLALITKRYFNISQKGKSWFGNSFYIAYDGDKSFSNRWTIMALESKFNEIIFEYLFKLENKDINIPVSVEEQISFIKENKILDENLLNRLEKSWRILSASRNAKQNNTWTDMSDTERKAIDEINKFVGEYAIAEAMEEKTVGKVKNYSDLLSLIEEFVYDNSTNIETFRRGYNKYSHLQTWKGFSSDKNGNIFVKAQIVALLAEIDSLELREKLKQMKISQQYLDFIFESLDAIKLIDNTFPKYSQIEGERSVQNYWDAVAATVKNPETMFALIAHKLTIAQSSQNKEDQLLLYAIYLPLSKRFGNADIYEYVRNDTFECTHPAEYLNLLNIINTLYGIPYSKLKDYNENLKGTLKSYFIDNGLSLNNIEIKNRVKSLYSIYEKLNSSRKKEHKELRPLSEIEKNAVKFILTSDVNVCNNLIKNISSTEDIGSVNVIKDKIMKCMDKNFDDLDNEEKELLLNLFTQMKNSVFSDYEFVDYINSALSPVLKKCKGSDGLVDISKLKEILKNSGNQTALELWFVDFFESELKDLVGLHVVVEDKEYDSVIDVVERTNDTEQSYLELINYFLNGKDSIKFEKFKKDEKNKHARLKLNASIKIAEGIPVPVEMCIYEKSDYEAETYGVYNQKKISSPHYIYKMGKEIDNSFFENIFSNEINYDFIDSSDDQKKRMIFVADGFVPTDNLADNFNKIMENISDNITCFVEYEDSMFIQKLPKGSTIYDLATGRAFSDDVNVSVYTDAGDQITSEVPLTDVKTYKVVKREGCFVALPEDERDIHTTRAKLIYKRVKDKKDKNISSFIKGIGNISDITAVINLLLEEEKFKEMFDERKSALDIAAEMYDESSDNEILKNEESIKKLLGFISNIILSKGFEETLPSSFVKRSTQIANHYNLANMLELFEAIDSGIIDFESIEPFYNTCAVIKTSSDIPADKIVKQIEKTFRIKKIKAKDKKYNLVINKDRYFVENLPLTDAENIQKFIDIISSSFNVEYVADIRNKKIEEQKDTLFVGEDFVQPQQEFPLMSLGNNVETLVQHAMLNHADLVNAIVRTTEEIAHPDTKEVTADNITSLVEEYPVLMTKMLLGLYSRESYDEQEMLAQESPYLTQEELNIISDNIINPNLSEFANLKERFGVDFQPVNISDVKFVISRSLDLVEDTDTFSFATLDIDSQTGTATLYISEAFLRELDKQSKEEKEYLLKQLALHEITEYLLLSQNSGINYEDVHEQFEQYQGQSDLMEFAKTIASPNVVQTKNAMYQEVDALLEPSDIDKMDAQSTVGLLLGNLNVSSFEQTYKLYKEGKLGKIFITGNTRGTVQIISSLRKNPKYMANIRKTITRLEDIETVEDLLSLTDEEFEKLETEDRKLRYNKKHNISETYINRISMNEKVSEAYIIKWVLMEYAKQDGMSKEDMEKFEKSVVLETKAANTPQNIENTFTHPEFADFVSNKDNINVVIIQTPFSQPRARATLNKYLHTNSQNALLQNKKFNIYSMNFDYNDVLDYYGDMTMLSKSLGEWTRLIAYSLKGDIIPVTNSQEGLNSIPLEIFPKIFGLLPVLTEQEKAELVKVFENIKPQDSKFDSLETLLPVLQEQVGIGNRYNLISDFITYLYSDTTEQRYLEKKWSNGNIEEELQNLPVFDKDSISLKDTVETTYQLLSAA